MNTDTNAIIRAYLITQTDLTDLIGGGTPRIYCPRLPENCELPALGFFTRGGVDNPHIPEIEIPSVQFDCWADNAFDAREVYRALYSILQGIQEIDVTYDGSDYRILSAWEEVKGQDLQDMDIPNYFRVVTFFRIEIQATAP